MTCPNEANLLAQANCNCADCAAARLFVKKKSSLATILSTKFSKFYNDIVPEVTPINVIAFIFVLIFAIGCGVTIFSAIFALNIFSGGILTYVIASILAIATTITNIRMMQGAVPAVLIDLFGKGQFMAGFTKTKGGQYLSAKKLVAMAFGALLVLSAGAMFGALTYQSIILLSTSLLFLGTVTSLLPPVAMLLGVVTFVCISALMLQTIAEFLKKDDIKSFLKNYFKDLFNTAPDFPTNRGRSPLKIKVLLSLKIIAVVILLPLSMIGLALMMNNCTAGLTSILLSIPHAIPSAVHIASNVIGMGFALLGQVPFNFQKILLTINNFFDKAPVKTVKNANGIDSNSQQPRNIATVLLGVLGESLRIINAVSNGVLSAVGAHGHGAAAAGLGGGILNSYVGAEQEREAGESTEEITTKATQQTSAGSKKDFDETPLIDRRNRYSFHKLPKEDQSAKIEKSANQHYGRRLTV